MAVTGLAGAVVLRGYLPANPRIVVYGDSLMVEAQDDFRAAATQAGAHAILMKMWSGTAPCNWLDDVSGTIRDFQPTIAVIAFSGNRPPCMSGRDLIAAYRADVTAMTEKLAASGVEVRLVETPPRRGEAVDADGRTELDRLWAQIASTTPHTRVIRAGQSISDHGRFTTTLPCAPEDSCGPDGRVVVRAPDGIHFCPRPTEPAGVCPVYSGGARRYGLAVARGVLG
ncbi:hypothetical protein BCD48_38405 [Pseudofrankia sp. BMG5.36]|nr:hypothetical protein BCD48_38405 [Pseudofrankia sp. BMG5.36]